MRIISKFRDFYDHFAHNRMLSDQTRIWERHTLELPFSLSIPQGFHTFERVDSRKEAIGFHIFFCGRVIPVIFTHDERHNDVFHYSPDTLPVWLKNYFSLSIYLFGPAFAQTFFSSVKWEEKDGKGRILSTWNLTDMHRKLNTPVFTLSPHITKDGFYFYTARETEKETVVLNPELNRFDFRKSISDFDCFMELERFLSNDLVPRDTRGDVKISDKLKAETHGFDKHSFRKDKAN